MYANREAIIEGIAPKRPTTHENISFRLLIDASLLSDPSFVPKSKSTQKKTIACVILSTNRIANTAATN
jgi:hypothetical protein